MSPEINAEGTNEPPTEWEFAEVPSDVHGHIRVDFGPDMPGPLCGRHTSSLRTHVVVVEGDDEDECTQIARQIKDALDEAVYYLITQVWSVYETQRKADESDAYDVDGGMQRLRTLRHKLGIAEVYPVVLDGE